MCGLRELSKRTTGQSKNFWLAAFFCGYTSNAIAVKMSMFKTRLAWKTSFLSLEHIKMMVGLLPFNYWWLSFTTVSCMCVSICLVCLVLGMCPCLRDLHEQIVRSIKGLPWQGEDPRKLLQSLSRFRQPHCHFLWVCGEREQVFSFANCTNICRASDSCVSDLKFCNVQKMQCYRLWSLTGVQYINPSVCPQGSRNVGLDY